MVHPPHKEIRYDHPGDRWLTVCVTSRHQSSASRHLVGSVSLLFYLFIYYYYYFYFYLVLLEDLVLPLAGEGVAREVHAQQQHPEGRVLAPAPPGPAAPCTTRQCNG
jgi:hypothetical protein